MKTVFTTGEAAKICKVSQQTIIRCFDSGQLKGFRVPGSRFRRIPRDILYKFMQENSIPTDALESGKRKALIVDDDEELVELIRDVLESDGRFEVRVANNGFDAGMMVKEYHPDVIVLDVMLPDINGKEVCQRVRSDSNLDDVKIICISRHGRDDKIERPAGGRRQRLPPKAVRGREAGRTHVPSARHGTGTSRSLTRPDSPCHVPRGDSSRLSKRHFERSRVLSSTKSGRLHSSRTLQGGRSWSKPSIGRHRSCRRTLRLPFTTRTSHWSRLPPSSSPPFP